MVVIKLYCSICTRNDYYLERIEDVAKKLKLNYTLEKVTDEAAWKALDLEEACLSADPQSSSYGSQWYPAILERPSNRRGVRSVSGGILLTAEFVYSPRQTLSYSTNISQF